MGGHADRRTVYYGAVIHNDYVGIWQVFKLYIYTAIAPVPLSALRESRAKASARASLRAMPLYALKVRLSCLPALSFPICFFSACGQSRCGGGYNGMELYRGTCVQYARPCRCGQNGRPCCKRNDGLVREVL